jgi:hypothetical protein
MNYAIKRICCLLLLLLVSTTAHAVEFTDAARARAVITSQVKKLLENGQFARTGTLVSCVSCCEGLGRKSHRKLAYQAFECWRASDSRSSRRKLI